MSWDAVGDAIYRAIRRASGLDEDHVVWKHQSRNAPGLDYVAISLGTMVPVGVDFLTQKYDADRPRGEEFEIRTQGTRESTIDVEAFTTESVSGRDAAALALVSRLYSGLLLPSVRQLLDAQDVSIFDVSTVTWIPDVPSTGFRGRAVGTLRCYMRAPTASEFVGYIERVSGAVVMQGGANGDMVQAFDTRAVTPGDED